MNIGTYGNSPVDIIKTFTNNLIGNVKDVPKQNYESKITLMERKSIVFDRNGTKKTSLSDCLAICCMESNQMVFFCALHVNFTAQFSLQR